MNTLDLPPRRPLPRETRDRMRRTVDTGTAGPPRRSRAPLAAAAAVLLGAVAAFIGTSASRDDPREAAPPGAEFSTPTMVLGGGRTEADLDRCADVAAASPRAADFAPRGRWRPKFTTALPDGTRVTAFVSAGGTPSFCQVTASTATISDPKADPVTIATAPAGLRPASVAGVYLSPTGVLAGVVEGPTALEFFFYRDNRFVPISAPTVQDGLFVVQLGDFGDDDVLEVVGRNSQGMSVLSGSVSLAPAARPAAGVTG